MTDWRKTISYLRITYDFPNELESVAREGGRSRIPKTLVDVKNNGWMVSWLVLDQKVEKKFKDHYVTKDYIMKCKTGDPYRRLYCKLRVSFVRWVGWTGCGLALILVSGVFEYHLSSAQALNLTDITINNQSTAGWVSVNIWSKYLESSDLIGIHSCVQVNYACRCTTCKICYLFSLLALGDTMKSSP